MNKTIYKAGYWSGMVAFTATLAFYIVQILQVWGLLSYPRDEILIYGFSLCITIPFMIEMLALHYAVAPENKFWSHGALLCTVIYVVFVAANYVVQLATVIPMTLSGSTDEIQLLRQTPHSLFWDFDAAGYILMGMAALFARTCISKTGISKMGQVFFPGSCGRYSFNCICLFLPKFFQQYIDACNTLGHYSSFVYAAACDIF
jgi:hypothetical protein